MNMKEQGKMILCWILLMSLIYTVASADLKEASVTYDEELKKFTIHDSVVDDCVAYGNFEDEIFQTGWAYLEVSSHEHYPDSIQAYAAGLVEGHLTTSLIADHWFNMATDYCKGEEEFCAKLQNFLVENMKFLNENIASQRESDGYWHQVALTLEHLNGVEDGYKNLTRAPSTDVNVLGLLYLNIFGDLIDLEEVLGKKNITKILGAGKCSGLIKVLPNNEDIYFSHVTWNFYNSMLRILKKYSLKFHTSLEEGSPVVPGHSYSFSSGPGMIFSVDDFYLISSGLAAFETSLDNINAELWKLVKPDAGVLEWQRNIIANRLATSSKHWVDIFGKMNSGTYNNQWNILNYNLFEPGKPLPNDLLWTVEQMPGYLRSEDTTYKLLQQGYFPSYNVAFFKDVFALCGAQTMVDELGDFYSYDNCPRAQIFRRDQGSVTDLNSMIKLMRYNDYTHDPIARCNCSPPYSAINGISARGDLNDVNGDYPFEALQHRPIGATDMKLTNSTMFKKLEFVAIGGPTYDSVPPFQWSKTDFKLNHRGQPDLWNFKPVVRKWK